MDGKTHLASGILTSYMVISNFPQVQSQAIFIAGGLCVGALLPDIDLHNSLLGRCVRPISDMLEAFVSHRTVTHNVFFMIIVSLIVGHFNAILGYSICAGIFLHLLLDAITPHGIKWFYPFT